MRKIFITAFLKQDCEQLRVSGMGTFVASLLAMTLTILICFGLLARADQTTESAPATQQLQNFNLNGYNNSGVKTWSVNGTQANIMDQTIDIANVDANFYGKQMGNIKSDRGNIDKVNGNIHLQDNVILTVQGRNTRMTTNTLDWNRNKDLVKTKDPVKIVDAQAVVTGRGMIAHPTLRQAQINNNVKAVLNTNVKQPQNSHKITITCDGAMKMDQMKMYAVFHDHVVAIDATVGRKLYADKMEIWFSQVTKHIKKAVCTGHVKVVQGGSTSSADKMIYMGDTQLLTMIGHPKIFFNTNAMQGHATNF